MKKTFFAILLALILCVSVSVPALAATAGEYVYDHNGNISDANINELNALASQVYDAYGYDVCVDIDDSVTENAISYAEQRYEEIGASENGMLLAITAESWYIHLSGETAQMFTEADEDTLWDAYNAEGTYTDGVRAFIETAELFFSGQAPSSAADHEAAGTIPNTRLAPLLVDDADLLTLEEEDQLMAKLETISNEQQCEVAVVTVNSLGGKTATAFADDYYDYNGYGAGEGRDGIILLISMADRDWAISTHGYAITVFTDAGQAHMVDAFRPYLSNGEYAAAFECFADLCDEYLVQAKTDKPYDIDNLQDDYYQEETKVGFLRGFMNLLVITLPVGIILSFLITGIMKSKLKSVRRQSAASNYVREGSVNITDSRDVFLYRSVSKTAKEKSSSSSSGSSTHSSSSGSSHGGSSGKF